MQEEAPEHRRPDRFAILSGKLLERADTLIYTIVGISFLLGALIALGYGFYEFANGINKALHPELNAKEVFTIAIAVIQFISDMLLVLIIMEVLSTVIHYLRSHATSLRPFLFIGIISATRSILSIGARLSVSTGSSLDAEFWREMVELGVSAAVVLALGITLKLLGKAIDLDSQGE